MITIIKLSQSLLVSSPGKHEGGFFHLTNTVSTVVKSGLCSQM